MQIQRGISQDGCRNSGQANINGLCLHMETMLGYARVRASMPQKLVAPRRAISADNIDLAIDVVTGRGQIVEQVEQAGIDVTDLTGAMVP